MRQVSQSNLKSRYFRFAWIAGASASDTPNSDAAWSCVYRWPGNDHETVELSGRVPRHLRYNTGIQPRVERLAGYPGTLLAAEWLACYKAISFARTAEPKYESLAFPLQIYTTRKDIALVLDGEAPLSEHAWLSRIHQHICPQVLGDLDYRGPGRRTRRYFRPEDRPMLGGRSDRAFGGKVPVYVRIVTTQQNRRALRLARAALSRGEPADMLDLRD